MHMVDSTHLEACNLCLRPQGFCEGISRNTSPLQPPHGQAPELAEVELFRTTISLLSLSLQLDEVSHAMVKE